MVGRRADLQTAADIFDAFAAGQLFVGPHQLLDDFFGCVSLSFHENVAARSAAKLSYHPDQFTGSTPSSLFGSQRE